MKGIMQSSNAFKRGTFDTNLAFDDLIVLTKGAFYFRLYYVEVVTSVRVVQQM